MLLMFKVKNYTSFKNETILDMRAATCTQHLSHIIKINGKPGLLKTTALYGANASGKSNLVSAMFFFKQYIFSQFINKKQNGDYIPGKTGMAMKLEPFYLSDNGDNASEFDIIFLHNDKQIQYGFECTLKEVLNEWLFIDDKKVFERTGKELSFGNKYKIYWKHIKNCLLKDFILLYLNIFLMKNQKNRA